MSKNKNKDMSKRINRVLDRFETALVKLQAGETSSDFLSVLKGAIDLGVRMYPDIGRLQFQRQLEQGLCEGIVPPEIVDRPNVGERKTDVPG